MEVTERRQYLDTPSFPHLDTHLFLGLRSCGLQKLFHISRRHVLCDENESRLIVLVFGRPVLMNFYDVGMVY